MTAIAADRQSVVGAPSKPVLWWAFIGAWFVILDIYVLSAWIMSDKFVTNDPGPEPVPGYTYFFINLFEVFGVVFGAATLIWIYRNYKKNAALSTYAVLVFGWVTAVWQDPLDNYLRVVFGYSSIFVNYGSWSEFIPGWIAPNGSLMPEPVFFTGLNYLVTIPISALIVAWALRKVKRSRPQISVMGLVVTAIAAMILYDFILEVFWVRSGMYAYMGAIESVTIAAGKSYQFPIYVSLTWGPVLGIVGSMYYFRDDKGRMLAERGIDDVKARRGKGILRILAVGGFINILYLLYDIIFIFISYQIDPWPTNMPDHLRNEMCGEGTQYECPGYDVPIPMPESGPLEPYTGRN